MMMRFHSEPNIKMLPPPSVVEVAIRVTAAGTFRWMNHLSVRIECPEEYRRSASQNSHHGTGAIQEKRYILALEGLTYRKRALSIVACSNDILKLFCFRFVSLPNIDVREIGLMSQ